MMLSKSLARLGSSRYCALRHTDAKAVVPTIRTTAVRYLNVHEYISMELMASHGIQTPECHVAETPQEVDHIFNTSFHRSGGTFFDTFLCFCI
jgi:hypothetical protein